MSGTCVVCFSAPRKGIPFLTCDVCKKDVHISCTVSKRVGARAVCSICGGASPSTTKKKRKEKAASTSISNKEGKHDTLQRPSLTRSSSSSNTITKQNASTSRDSSHTALHSNSTSTRQRTSTSRDSCHAASSPSLKIAAANSCAGHEAPKQTEKGDSPTPPGTSSAIFPLNKATPSNQLAMGSQALMKTDNMSMSESSFNFSFDDSFLKILDVTKIEKSTVVSTMVKYVHDSHKGISRRFDGLQLSIDDKIGDLKRDVAILPAMNSLMSELVTKLSSIEGLLQAQSSKLEELTSKNQILADANSKLERKISVLEERLLTMVDTHDTLDLRTDVTNRADGADSCAQAPLSLPVVSRSGSAGGVPIVPSTMDSEVVITGAVKSSAPTSILSDVAAAVLGSLIPSLEKQDIVDVRPLGSRGAAGRAENLSEGGESSQPDRPISLRIKLSTREQAQSIVRAKRRLNYFSRNDLNPSLLTPEISPFILNRRIFINEALPSKAYKHFISLKQIARSLGFRYVWHSGGRTLVRFKGGDRAHAISSASDLDTIARAGQYDKGNPPQEPKSSDRSSGKGSV